MRKDDWYKICGIAAGMCVMLAAALSAAAYIDRKKREKEA